MITMPAVPIDVFAGRMGTPAATGGPRGSAASDRTSLASIDGAPAGVLDEPPPSVHLRPGMLPITSISEKRMGSLDFLAGGTLKELGGVALADVHTAATVAGRADQAEDRLRRLQVCDRRTWSWHTHVAAAHLYAVSLHTPALAPCAHRRC